jgi:hypothetical protein
MKLEGVMTTLRILAAATAVGLVAYWLLSLAPPAWFKWFPIVIGIVLLAGVVIDNRRSLAEIRRREWLRLFAHVEASAGHQTLPAPEDVR